MNNSEILKLLEEKKKEQRVIKETAISSREVRVDGAHSSNLYIKLPQALEKLYEDLENELKNETNLKDYILSEIKGREDIIKEDKEKLKKEKIGLIPRVGLTVRVNISTEEIKEYRKVLELL